MRKVNLLGCAAFVALSLSLGACSTVEKTSTTIPVETSVVSQANADLQVAQQKISYTLKPSKSVRRGGEKNVINTTVAEALKANGDADVLVGAQYEVKKSRNLFGVKKISYVTVTGYPAKYVNIKPVK